jgi:hypothetical protein
MEFERYCKVHLSELVTAPLVEHYLSVLQAECPELVNISRSVVGSTKLAPLLAQTLATRGTIAPLPAVLLTVLESTYGERVHERVAAESLRDQALSPA